MRARVVASAAMAAIAAIVLAGCNFITPMATLKPYDPSDGVSTKVGDVTILNVLVISEDGEHGNLIFSTVNTSGDEVDLVVQYGEAGASEDLELTVGTGASEFGFGEGGQLFLEGIDVKVGQYFPVYFQYGDEEGEQLQVPVLDGSLSEYSDLLPTEPPTPEPTETSVPTPDPTETPAS